MRLKINEKKQEATIILTSPDGDVATETTTIKKLHKILYGWEIRLQKNYNKKSEQDV